MEHEFKVVKLHNVPDLIEETARLINSEWPRSLEARCVVIGQSSDDLPCSLVLLKVLTDGNVRTVVGFSHLSKVLQKPKSVLVESVIVDKSLRGCGLGKMIMKHTEEFALKHGYEMMHLSTHDKQSFYERLGYSLSTPVSAETKVSRFLSKLQIEKGAVQHKERTHSMKSDLKTEEMAKPSPCVVPQAVPSLSVPKPPPAPSLSIPPAPANILSVSKERGSKVYIWMKKQLF